jgi:outer membrane protein assembly factor BamB
MKKHIVILAVLLLVPVIFLQAAKPGKVVWSSTPKGGKIDPARDVFGCGSTAIGDGGEIYLGIPIGADKLMRVKDPGLMGVLAGLAPEVVWDYHDAGSGIPVVGPDGTIYIQAFSDKQLDAVNPNGSQKWTFKLGGDFFPHVAVGPDGTIYFKAHHSMDRHLYAVNPNGTLKWRYDFGEYSARSAPVVAADGTVFVVGDYCLVAFNPDGTMKWNRDSTAWWRYTGTPDTVGPFIDAQDQAIGDGGVLYAGGHIKYRYGSSGIPKEKRFYYLFAFDTETGEEIWRYHIKVVSGPAIGEDGTIYIGAQRYNEVSQEWDNYLLALNPDGSFKWEFPVQIPVAPPTVGSNGNIYFGSFYTVYAVNPSGNLEWKVDARQKTNDSGDWIYATLTIDDEGIIHFWNDRVYGIQTGSKGLADSPWPKYRCNNKNTGCIASK